MTTRRPASPASSTPGGQPPAAGSATRPPAAVAHRDLSRAPTDGGAALPAASEVRRDLPRAPTDGCAARPVAAELRHHLSRGPTDPCATRPAAAEVRRDLPRAPTDAGAMLPTRPGARRSRWPARLLAPLLALVLLVPAEPARAGGRGRFGGVLQVALVAPPGPVTPDAPDSPVDALRLALTHQPLCRLGTLTRPGPRALRLELHPGVEPAAVVALLARVRGSEAPARSLLANVTGWSPSARAVDLELGGPAPGLERALCHPAFSLPTGPFRARGQRLEPVDAQPAGRPWLDGVALQATDARTAERLLAQRKVHLLVGAGGQGDPAQLFATALRLGGGLGPHFRAAVEASVDRGDLARFFVSAPAGPLPSLVPVALGPSPAPAPPPRPSPRAPVLEVALRFDDAAEHERAIAQRLQVKLQPFGYRLALKPTPRAALRGQAPGEFEATLVSLLLPPTAVGALQVWCDVAGQRERLPALLQQLGAAADPEARARELAPSLALELPLLPLVTRGLGVTAAPEVQRLGRDELGLPRLDDVFLAPE